MDVPFSTSGALSRRHYALIRNVESTTSTQGADDYLHAEIQSLHISLTRPALTSAQCKEYLVILLYCFNMIEHAFTPGLFDFALPHAVNLAETGKTIEQKRIGYHFCSELMRSDDELQVMLVNTVRKDLESASPARACLALESLVALPSEYLVPAVQSRVQDLLSHSSPQVRRRAIHACRILSSRENNILLSSSSILVKRLNDPDCTVINAAITAISSPMFRCEADAGDLSKVKTVVHGLVFDHKSESQPYQLHALSALPLLGDLDQTWITYLSDLAYRAAQRRNLSILYASYHLLSRYTVEQLKANIMASPIFNVRDLLASEDPNLHYLFLTILGFFDAFFWAGSSKEYPNVLEGKEVEKIMQFVESPDSSIRKKTVRVLMMVDHNILEAIYTRFVRELSLEVDERTREEHTIRLLEVVNEKAGDNGELYAQAVANLFANNMTPVSEAALEVILSRIRDGSLVFQVECAASLIAPVTEQALNLGPTMLVIICALATQYSNLVSIPPTAILSGLALRLRGMQPSVQDACILTMLWLAADCEVPMDVQEAVVEIQDQAGRHIRKRCTQFQSLSQEKGILQDIIQRSQGRTLPDLLLSLESYEGERTQKLQPIARASESGGPSGSKLRYDAYDAPHMTPKLRVSKYLQRHPSKDAKERDLTQNVDTLVPKAKSSTLLTESLPFNDLIAFDQPDPSSPGHSFPSIWESMDGSACDERGWSGNEVSGLIEKLRASGNLKLHIIPEACSGEVKIIITADSEEIVVLKLINPEEGGTLWRLRARKAELGKRLKEVLTD